MENLIIIRHQSSLRSVTRAETLSAVDQEMLALPRIDIELDSRPYVEDIEGGYWSDAHEYLRSQAALIRQHLEHLGSAAIVHIGLPEIPFAVALGAYVGDEHAAMVHDYHRDLNSWTWPSTIRTVNVVRLDTPTDRVSQSGIVVLRVETSYSIADADVDAVVSNERLADVTVRLRGDNPAPGIIRSLKDVEAVRIEVRAALAAIDAARPNAEIIHLFLSAPPSICFAVGRELRLRNGPPVQTYRYRSTADGTAYQPAFLLTAQSLGGVERPLSEQQMKSAAALRAMWGEVLKDLIAYVRGSHERIGTQEPEWFSLMPFSAELSLLPVLKGLPPLWHLLADGDAVAVEPRPEDYAFDKEARLWRISDRLLLGLNAAVAGDKERFRAAVRLFLFHEYLHDWQDLTKYTAEDVGSFANCLERIDYAADLYAILHEADMASRSGVVGSDALRAFIADRIELIVRTFWAFEPLIPHVQWQERRLRRYLNWFWRRVQIREASSIADAFSTLGRAVSIEIAGLQYRTGRGRIFVLLDKPRPGDILEIGLVLEDGRFYRHGSTSDLQIEDLLRAFIEHDHGRVQTFFNGLYEHVRQTDGAILRARL